MFKEVSHDGNANVLLVLCDNSDALIEYVKHNYNVNNNIMYVNSSTDISEVYIPIFTPFMFVIDDEKCALKIFNEHDPRWLYASADNIVHPSIMIPLGFVPKTVDVINLYIKTFPSDTPKHEMEIDIYESLGYITRDNTGFVTATYKLKFIILNLHDDILQASGISQMPTLFYNDNAILNSLKPQDRHTLLIFTCRALCPPVCATLYDDVSI